MFENCVSHTRTHNADVPRDPITFLVISFFGRTIINNQNGCGPNVAKAKAEWIGSGLTPTISIFREVEVRERSTGGLESAGCGLKNADDKVACRSTATRKKTKLRQQEATILNYLKKVLNPIPQTQSLIASSATVSTVGHIKVSDLAFHSFFCCDGLLTRDKPRNRRAPNRHRYTT